MDSKPIVSIIIPTYNRVSFLQTTVNLFIEQIKQEHVETSVEVVIGNDASASSVAEYFKTLEMHPFVRTFTNEKNLGLSGNVEKLARQARGEYLWLFGEDDLITPGSLKRLLDSITADKPNVVLFNTVNMVSDDDKNLQYNIIGNNRLTISQDIFIESFAKERQKLAVAKDWLYLTNLVSASAFKRDLYLAELPEAQKYITYDNVYLFQGPIILIIAKYGRFKIVAERSVLHRKNETHWSKTIAGQFQVSLYGGSEVVNLIRQYLPSERKAYQKIFAVQTFAAVKRGKATGEAAITKDILGALKNYYDCFPYSLRFLIALITPGIIFKKFAKV